MGPSVLAHVGGLDAGWSGEPSGLVRAPGAQGGVRSVALWSAPSALASHGPGVSGTPALAVAVLAVYAANSGHADRYTYHSSSSAEPGAARDASGWLGFCAVPILFRLMSPSPLAVYLGRHPSYTTRHEYHRTHTRPGPGPSPR